MKTLKFKMALAIALIVLLLTSCEKNDDVMSNVVIEDIEEIVESGDWVITHFMDSGKDETYHFDGYKFSFLENGVIESTNGIEIHRGKWSISFDSSNYGTHGETDFNIYFGSEEGEFEELTDDWDIISQSANKIDLVDISGGNGGTDYLTFERN